MSVNYASSPKGYSLPQIASFILILSFGVSSLVSVEPAPYDILMLIGFSILLVSGMSKSSQNILIVAFIHYAFVLISSLVAVLYKEFDLTYLIKYLIAQLVLSISFIYIYDLLRSDNLLILKSLETMVIGAIITSVLVLGLHFSFSPDFIYRDEFFNRISGFFKDPNVLGPYLLFPLLLLVQSKNKKIITRSILALPLIILIYYTYSRAAYAATVIALTLVLFFSLIEKKRNYSGGLLLVSGVVIILLLYLIYGNAQLPSIFGTDDFLASRLSVMSYDNERFEDIRVGFSEGGSTLFGLGPGGYAVLHDHSPHNLIVGRLTDVGWVPTLITVFALCVATLRSGVLAISKQRDIVSISVFSALLAHLFISMVVNTHHWRHLWLLIAISLAMHAHIIVFGKSKRVL